MWMYVWVMCEQLGALFGDGGWRTLSYYSCIVCVKMHNGSGYRNGNYANSDTKIRAYRMFMCHDGHFVPVISKCDPLFCSPSMRFVAIHCAMCSIYTNESDM